MSTLTLEPVKLAQGEVRLPGSKSITNRALLLAALAEGRTDVVNALDSEDTRYMLEALGTLGVGIELRGADWRVEGRNGPLVREDREHVLELGMAGTAYRPLTAALCLGSGRFELRCSRRMTERPIAPLIDALRALGARIRYLGAEGYPPLAIEAGGLSGGRVSVPGNLSSQFLTSLLLAAPLARGPVIVDVPGEQVSKPYLDITLDLMARFGVEVGHDDYRHFEIPVRGYASPGRYLVEGDASSATYFLAAGAIRTGPVRVIGLGRRSIQGDLAFVDVLRAMGATVDVADEYVEARGGRLRGVDLDLNAIPDAAMTVAVLALFADGATRIRNVYNWRVKETDRMTAMATELRKLGARVASGEDWIRIEPPRSLPPVTIDTYGDHRMAMCFSLVALGGVCVTIRDPECVAKTYPEYFEAFESICQR